MTRDTPTVLLQSVRQWSRWRENGGITLPRHVFVIFYHSSLLLKVQAALKKHWANYKESRSCSSVQNFKNRRSCSMVTSTFDLTLNQVICWSVSLLQLTRTLWLINCLLFSLPLRSYFIHIHMKSSAPYESTILKIIENDCNLFQKILLFFFARREFRTNSARRVHWFESSRATVLIRNPYYEARKLRPKIPKPIILYITLSTYILRHGKSRFRP